MPEGQIMKALSGFYYVESNEKVYACRGRGVFRNKKINPLVGDFVHFDLTNEGEGYIQEVKQRDNEFIRPPIANITQAIVVNAIVHPSFSTILLDRFLVVLESKGIKPVILITKKDLANPEAIEELEKYQKEYERIGYTVEFTSLSFDTDEEQELHAIKAFLKDEVTVLVGQSGVGKSSLLNALNPDFSIKTDDISESLGRGKHTTRHVELMKVNDGLVADTPGFSSLELTEVGAEQLSDFFIDMKKVSPNCKFRSCLHDKEPKCAVKQAVEDKEITSYRYQHYLSFLQEILSRKPRYSS